MCTHRYSAPFFFFSYYLLANAVLGNLFVSIILDKFTAQTQQVGVGMIHPQRPSTHLPTLVACVERHPMMSSSMFSWVNATHNCSPCGSMHFRPLFLESNASSTL